MVWGWSLAGGVGVILGLGVSGVVLGGNWLVGCLCLLRGSVSCMRGPPPLGDGRIFFLVSIHLGTGRIGLVFHNLFIFLKVCHYFLCLGTW